MISIYIRYVCLKKKVYNIHTSTFFLSISFLYIVHILDNVNFCNYIKRRNFQVYYYKKKR